MALGSPREGRLELTSGTSGSRSEAAQPRVCWLCPLCAGSHTLLTCLQGTHFPSWLKSSRYLTPKQKKRCYFSHVSCVSPVPCLFLWFLWSVGGIFFIPLKRVVWTHFHGKLRAPRNTSSSRNQVRFVLRTALSLALSDVTFSLCHLWTWQSYVFHNVEVNEAPQPFFSSPWLLVRVGDRFEGHESAGPDVEPIATVEAKVGDGPAWEVSLRVGWTRAPFRLKGQGLLYEYDLLGDISEGRVGNGSEMYGLGNRWLVVSCTERESRGRRTALGEEAEWLQFGLRRVWSSGRVRGRIQ